MQNPIDLLFLVHRIPYPPRKGDKIRSYHMLTYLARHYRVSLCAFIDDEEDWAHTAEIDKLCAETKFVELNPRLKRLHSTVGLLTGEPLTLPYFRSAEIKRWVDDVVRRRQIRRMLVFSSSMAQYLPADPQGVTTRVIDFVDMDSDKWRQYSQQARWPLSWVYAREAKRLLAYETRIAAACQASVFVSRDEAECFLRSVPDARNITFVSNGVDIDYFSAERDYPNPYAEPAQTIVFTGAMDYWANVDSVRWFAQQIFPAVRNEHRDAQFYIVGARPTPEVVALGDTEGVTVTGSVEDIRPYIAHAAVAVAPLRLARGIQNKVLEALAMSRKVVATTAAVEGIVGLEQSGTVVRDEAPAFAAAVSRFLADSTDAAADLRNPRARACIIAHYQWEQNLARFKDLLENAPVPQLETASGA